VNPLIAKVVRFLLAATEQEARREAPVELPAKTEARGGQGSGPAAEAGDWWAALGGDSVAATLLIASWDEAERALIATPPTAERGDLNAAPKLTLRDVFRLCPWGLRGKAQARLGRGGAGGDGAGEGLRGGGGGGECRGRAPAAVAPAMAHTRLFWEEEVKPPLSNLLPRGISLPEAEDSPAPCGSGPCVVLTGATGFLGLP